MPAWRALVIFLFICLLFFIPPSVSAIGFLAQSIVTGLPHIQGEVNLNLIGHCLILPIADSCSWYWSQSCPPSHLITSLHVGQCVYLCLCQSVWWKMWSVSHWKNWKTLPTGRKMSKLEVVSIITQIYRWRDYTLDLCRIEPSADAAEVHQHNTSRKVPKNTALQVEVSPRRLYASRSVTVMIFPLKCIKHTVTVAWNCNQEEYLNEWTPT